MEENNQTQARPDEYKFTNQNWIKVLNEIWQFAPNKYGRGIKGYDDDNSLAKRLKIKGNELMLIAAFLEEQKLIEYDQQDNCIQLTSKGFDVAMQNSSGRRNDKLNKASLFLSLAIAVFAIVSLLLGIQDWSQRLIISILIVIALIIGGLTVLKI